MRILVIDDHALFRFGLQLLLGQLVSSAQVFEAANVPEALNCIAREQPVDLIFLDWHIPGTSGQEALGLLRDALPQVRQVILSADKSPSLIRTCVDLGAAAYISKDASPNVLLQALSVVMQGGIWLPQNVPSVSGSPSPATYLLESVEDSFPDLTQRQREVLCAMAQGMPNKVIARNLDISGDTVKQHLSVVYSVMNVRSRTEAVYVLAQRGIKVG